MDLLNVNDAISQYKLSRPNLNQRVTPTLLESLPKTGMMNGLAAPQIALPTQAVSTSITGEAQNAGALYNQIKQTGNKDALEGFQKTFVNYAKTGNTSELNNFVSAGMKMNEQNKFSDFTNMLSTANNLLTQLNSQASSKFVTEAVSTYSKFGAEGMNSYVSAVSSINSNFTGNAAEDLNAKKTSLSNLNTAWQAIKEQNGTKAEITSQMAEFAANINKQTNFTDLNNYIKNQYQQVKSNTPISSL